ncbi:MAG: hypothetical protein R3B72_48440 [Polyangiaceae bacterium]
MALRRPSASFLIGAALLTVACGSSEQSDAPSLGSGAEGGSSTQGGGTGVGGGFGGAGASGGTSHVGGHAAGGSGAAGGQGTGGGGASGAGGSGGGGGSGGSGAGGAGGAGGGGLTCSPATAVPNANVAYSSPFAPAVMGVAGDAYVFHTGDTQWQHWTGSSWLQQAVPWPSSLAGMTPQLVSNSAFPKRLPSGDVIVSVLTPPSTSWFTTFDGVSLADPIQRPNNTNGFMGITRTSDGRYHVLTTTTALAVTSGDPMNGWSAPVPLNVGAVSSTSQAGIAVTPDDRLVVAYANGSPRHLYVTTKPLAGSWTPPIDLTPTWQAEAQHVEIASASDGVVLGVEAALTTHPSLWTSPNGQTFSQLSLQSTVGAGLMFLGAECIDNPAVVLGSHAGHFAYSHDGSGWASLGQLIINYIDATALQIMPDGLTIWAMRYSGNQIDLRVAP